MSSTRCIEVEAPPYDVANWIIAQTEGFENVLELGAGRFEKLMLTKASVRVGIEIFQPYVDQFATDQCVAICGDMLEYDTLLKDNGILSGDLVMLIDSIEHIKKDDGKDLLLRLKDDFRRVIVLTPNGPLEQTTDNWGYGNHYNQTHKSTWYPEDFTELKYQAKISETNAGHILATWDS